MKKTNSYSLKHLFLAMYLNALQYCSKSHGSENQMNTYNMHLEEYASYGLCMYIMFKSLEY